HHNSCSRIFFTVTPPTDISTLSLHDALPIFDLVLRGVPFGVDQHDDVGIAGDDVLPADVRPRVVDVGEDVLQPQYAHHHRRHVRSEEHTSELQSRENLVCRLLLEKKNYTQTR